MTTYDETPISSLPSAGRTLTLRTIALVLALGFAAALLVLLVAPWQQSASGTGRVIAYAPLERRQAVEAPIDGRLIGFFVQEGERVVKGQPIAELSDNDPEILQRLTQERDAQHSQIEAVSLSLSLMEAQVISQEGARSAALLGANARTRMASDRQDAADRAIDAASATLATAQANLQRLSTLVESGLASRRDYELALLDSTKAETELARAKAQAKAAESEVRAMVAYEEQVASSNRASIDSTRASIEKLRAERGKVEAELAKVEVRLARQAQMQVTAPRDGVVFRVVAAQGTEMVKAGDPLVILVPDVEDRAVELYVDGNDAPLITEGRSVRLQFEGWPAVQFVGWPSVAVGTFAGRVAFADSHADDAGHFRIVIVPDAGSEWPTSRYLRQGVRANGWVLLDQVKLGFELWRQFNGFPPAIKRNEDKVKSSTSDGLEKKASGGEGK